MKIHILYIHGQLNPHKCKQRHTHAHSHLYTETNTTQNMYKAPKKINILVQKTLSTELI